MPEERKKETASDSKTGTPKVETPKPVAKYKAPSFRVVAISLVVLVLMTIFTAMMDKEKSPTPDQDGNKKGPKTQTVSKEMDFHAYTKEWAAEFYGTEPLPESGESTGKE